MNKLIIMGNMTADPELTRKPGKDGKESIYAKFQVAVGRRQKQKDGADTDFFNVTAFGRQAEFVEKYFHKGTKMLVEGRVQNNNYTNKEGAKIYGFDVIAENIEFAQKKSKENAEGEFTSAEGDEPPFR